MLNRKNFIISLLLPLFVGCGGGGGGVDSVVNTATTTSQLTLETCREDYTDYTNEQWVEAEVYGVDKAKATACYEALVTYPEQGEDSQIPIYSYNNGNYDYLNDTQIIDDNIADTGVYSYKTELEYMKNNPNDKLSSEDCRAYRGGGSSPAEGLRGAEWEATIVPGSKRTWKDVMDILITNIAPADNMYRSVDGCQYVQTAVEYSNIEYSNAVKSAKMLPGTFSDE